jgi:putative ABC transport system permease protein
MTGGRGAASTESGDPVVRLITGYHRSAWWWMSVTCGALAVVVALAVLRVGTSAPASVQLTGSVPGTGAARSYDIIVSSPGTGGSGDSNGWAANPAALDGLSGGITLDQYEAIRKLPGVAVAAPLTMVGYVPFTVSAPMAIPAQVRAAAPTGVTLTVRLRSDNGLSTVTWDDVTVAYPTLKPSTLSVKLSWTFQLPLVAVDPAAEARLLNLNGAVTSGSYLPEAAPATGPVPVLMAGSIASAEAAQVTIDSPTGATATLTTASAYHQLVGEVTSTPGTISGYWTAGPVTYAPAPSGALTPEPVSTDLAAAWNGAYQWAGQPAEASALDVPFRTLTQHAALAGGAAVQAVGVFDPAKVASEPATPSPYSPELLAGADERSRQLLGGQPLAPGGDPADYAGSAASLVVPLADIGAFTSGYAGTASAAPIGVIRVRVAAASGDTDASEDKISAVAQEIVRATGLRVQPVLGTTATTRVVALPAGLHGRPPLLVSEVWYRSDVRTTVWTGLGLDSIVPVELELLAGGVGIGWSTWRLLHSRRRELATLRALGWRRRQLAGRLLAEFAPTAVIAVAAAALAGYAIGTALAGRLGWAWLLLCVPAVIAAVIRRARHTLLAAKGWDLARAPRGYQSRWPGWLPTSRSTRQGRVGAPTRLVRRRLRASWRRLLLRTLVIAGASVALSLQAAARWAFAGAASSWTQRPVTGLGMFVDGAAVLIVVLMGTFTVADLDWVALRERAVEVRTLRAIGWSALDLVRLTSRNAVGPGLSGGLIAGGADLLVGLPASGAAPLRLIALVILAAASGIALSLLANGLSTYSAIRAEAANN